MLACHADWHVACPCSRHVQPAACAQFPPDIWHFMLQEEPEPEFPPPEVFVDEATGNVVARIEVWHVHTLLSAAQPACSMWMMGALPRNSQL
jgi:hypothetical protein